MGLELENPYGMRASQVVALQNQYTTMPVSPLDVLEHGFLMFSYHDLKYILLF